MPLQGQRQSLRFAITLRWAALAIAIVFALEAFVTQSAQAQTVSDIYCPARLHSRK